jgi:hypothetical protein
MRKYVLSEPVEAIPASMYSGGDYTDFVYPDEWPMSKEDYDNYVARSTSKEAGYKVRYSDGYEAWMSKESFEEIFQDADSAVMRDMPDKIKEQIEILEKAQKISLECGNHIEVLNIAKTITELAGKYQK